MSADSDYINYDILFPNRSLSYQYLAYAGAGVPIYIVDQFWRVTLDCRYIQPPKVLSQRVSNSQEELHGLAVAAFAARMDVGVAEKAQIVMVDCGNTVETILAAVKKGYS